MGRINQAVCILGVTCLLPELVTASDEKAEPKAKPSTVVSVQAPGAAVKKDEGGVWVQAPYTDVQVDKRSGWLRVLAPFVHVEKQPDGRVWVLSPFFHVNVDKVPAVAADPRKPRPREATARQTQKPPYFGVAVTPVPEVLAVQFPNLLSKGQGLLVVSVRPESPAYKAGVRPHVVLLTFEGEKLSSPEDLGRLMAAARPGQKVRLGVLRSGKLENLIVTLGAR